jgi:hypothetical protein
MTDLIPHLAGSGLIAGAAGHAATSALGGALALNAVLGLLKPRSRWKSEAGWSVRAPICGPERPRAEICLSHSHRTWHVTYSCRAGRANVPHGGASPAVVDKI